MGKGVARRHKRAGRQRGRGASCVSPGSNLICVDHDAGQIQHGMINKLSDDILLEIFDLYRIAVVES